MSTTNPKIIPIQQYIESIINEIRTFEQAIASVQSRLKENPSNESLQLQLQLLNYEKLSLKNMVWLPIYVRIQNLSDTEIEEVKKELNDSFLANMSSLPNAEIKKQLLSLIPYHEELATILEESQKNPSTMIAAFAEMNMGAFDDKAKTDDSLTSNTINGSKMDFIIKLLNDFYKSLEEMKGICRDAENGMIRVEQNGLSPIILNELYDSIYYDAETHSLMKVKGLRSKMENLFRRFEDVTKKLAAEYIIGKLERLSSYIEDKDKINLETDATFLLDFHRDKLQKDTKKFLESPLYIFQNRRRKKEVIKDGFEQVLKWYQEADKALEEWLGPIQDSNSVYGAIHSNTTWLEGCKLLSESSQTYAYKNWQEMRRIVENISSMLHARDTISSKVIRDMSNGLQNNPSFLIELLAKAYLAEVIRKVKLHALSRIGTKGDIQGIIRCLTQIKNDVTIDDFKIIVGLERNNINTAATHLEDLGKNSLIDNEYIEFQRRVLQLKEAALFEGLDWCPTYLLIKGSSNALIEEVKPLLIKGTKERIEALSKEGNEKDVKDLADARELLNVLENGNPREIREFLIAHIPHIEEIKDLENRINYTNNDCALANSIRPSNSQLLASKIANPETIPLNLIRNLRVEQTSISRVTDLFKELGELQYKEIKTPNTPISYTLPEGLPPKLKEIVLSSPYYDAEKGVIIDPINLYVEIAHFLKILRHLTQYVKEMYNPQIQRLFANRENRGDNIRLLKRFYHLLPISDLNQIERLALMNAILRCSPLAKTKFALNNEEILDERIRTANDKIEAVYMNNELAKYFNDEFDITQPQMYEQQWEDLKAAIHTTIRETVKFKKSILALIDSEAFTSEHHQKVKEKIEMIAKVTTINDADYIRNTALALMANCNPIEKAIAIEYITDFVKRMQAMAQDYTLDVDDFVNTIVGMGLVAESTTLSIPSLVHKKRI